MKELVIDCFAGGGGASEEIDGKVTFGSLFSGGGGLDLGLEWAGMKCVFQVENDKHCLTILNRHWPNVQKNKVGPCMGLVGGDPCPVRSAMSNISKTTKPDMSGYFLAMAARIKPGWVLRENVPAPDVLEFKTALELLGYAAVVVEIDARSFTGQSRNRQFIAGFDVPERAGRFKVLVEREGNNWAASKNKSSAPFAKCLCTRQKGRNSAYDNYVYEEDRGLRHLSHAEREFFQGWPSGWTNGVPESARERITGNGVCSPVAEWIGKRIIKCLISTPPIAEALVRANVKLQEVEKEKAG